MKHLLYAVAAAVVSAPALAQVNDAAPGLAIDARTNPNLSINWERPYYDDNNYQSRVPGEYPIYDIGVPVTGVAATGGFAGPGGPGGAQAIASSMIIVNPAGVDLTIDAIKFGIWSSADPLAGNPPLFLKLEFFPTHTTTAAGTNPSSGAPITTVVSIGTGWGLGNNNGQFFAGFVGLLPAEQVVLPNFGNPGGPTVANTWSVVMSLWSDAAGTIPQCYFAPFSRANFTCAPAGSSVDNLRWFAAPQAGGLCPYFPGANRSGPTRANYMGFRAFRDTAAPVADHDMGVIAVGVDNTVGGVMPAGGGVRWIRFEIGALGAQDVNYTYLDVDNIGTAFDATMFLFTDGGTLIKQDDSDGPGTGAQLSFGMGRRAAVGDGLQYDGRDGELAPGVYWVGISGQGALASDGFLVSCPPALGGAYTVKVRNGRSVDTATMTTLEPSVAPLLAQPSFGAIVAPGAPLAAAAMGPFQVRWWSWDQCVTTDAVNTVTLDTLGADINIGHSHAVFDANGNLITSATGFPAPNIVFDNTAVLASCTYYVAHSWQGGNQFSPDSVNFGRWHFRNTSGNNGFTDGGTINVTNASCCTYTCDLDQNGTVDINDVLLLIDVVGGVTSFPQGICPDIEFDGAGDGITVNDALILLDVAGGTADCPFDRGC